MKIGWKWMYDPNQMAGERTVLYLSIDRIPWLRIKPIRSNRRRLYSLSLYDENGRERQLPVLFTLHELIAVIRSIHAEFVARTFAEASPE